jgi:L-fuculose-phosphate aldolase
MTHENIKDEIALYARLMYEKEYSVASEGNISRRSEHDSFYITPSNFIKKFLSGDDIVEIDGNGELLSGNLKPTTERFTHLEIYRQRPEINAIVHAHPFYTVLLNALGVNPFEKVFLSEAVMFLQDVAYSEFARPSTDEGAQVISTICRHSNMLVLDRHGVCTYAQNLHTAFSLLEIMEKYAKMYYYARLSGESIRFLDQAKIDDLKKVIY